MYKNNLTLLWVANFNIRICRIETFFAALLSFVGINILPSESISDILTCGTSSPWGGFFGS